MTSKVQPGDVNAPLPPPDPSIYGNVFDPPPAAYPADAGSTVPPVPPPHLYPGAQQPFGFTGVQVNIPTTAMLLSASTVPTQVQCMYCNANITTVTTKVATGATYFRAAILIIALAPTLTPVVYTQAASTDRVPGVNLAGQSPTDSNHCAGVVGTAARMPALARPQPTLRPPQTLTIKGVFTTSCTAHTLCSKSVFDFYSDRASSKRAGSHQHVSTNTSGLSFLPLHHHYSDDKRCRQENLSSDSCPAHLLLSGGWVSAAVPVGRLEGNCSHVSQLSTTTGQTPAIHGTKRKEPLYMEKSPETDFRLGGGTRMIKNPDVNTPVSITEYLTAKHLSPIAMSNSKISPDAAYPPLPPPAYSESTTGTSAPPPPPGIPGYGVQGATTAVYVTQPGALGPQNGSIVRFRDFPVTVICQHCQATITTSTHYSTGTFTWVSAGIVCLVGCWLGCCLIPFCLDYCKDVCHTCPNCRGIVGRFNRLS
ncbi:hypothetical protein BaRGS_00040482 [Batillaria attramentaria]|uniref:LITAF domain-containing protein n=1 Tax=Batillaria attramentaria TaxID=370345 RepID=A0ABD0J082_9CAEN